MCTAPSPARERPAPRKGRKWHEYSSPAPQTAWGLLAGQLLASQHHEVVAHARSESRAAETLRAFPQASAIVVGDLAMIEGMQAVARSASATGRIDAVIHNAAVGSSSGAL